MGATGPGATARCDGGALGGPRHRRRCRSDRGRALTPAGYDRDFKAIPPDGAPLRLDLTSVPRWQSVQLDARSKRIRVPTGVELDLGATAKALAADEAASAALEAAGEGGVLVSLGGDIA